MVSGLLCSLSGVAHPSRSSIPRLGTGANLIVTMDRLPKQVLYEAFQMLVAF